MDEAVVETVNACIAPSWRAEGNRPTRVRAALVRVVVRPQGVTAFVRREAISYDDPDPNDASCADAVEIKASGPLRRRGNAIVIDTKNARRPPKLNTALVRAVVLSRHWAGELASGKAASVREIARRHGLCHLYVGKLLPLAFLAPDLVEAIVEGRQPLGLSISNLLAEPLPMTWSEQRGRFDFSLDPSR